jgi:hypothetical protein
MLKKIVSCLQQMCGAGVKAEKVTSSLTKDGVLVVTAPRGNPAANQSYTHTIENNMNKVQHREQCEPVLHPHHREQCE